MARPAVIAAVTRSRLVFMPLSVKRSRDRQNGARSASPLRRFGGVAALPDRGLGGPRPYSRLLMAFLGESVTASTRGARAFSIRTGLTVRGLDRRCQAPGWQRDGTNRP